jgi:hypothetical protein
MNQPTAASTPATGSLSDMTPAAVQAGFVVGWRLAELYDRDELPPPREPEADAPVPAHLPGASEMSEHEKAGVILDQANAALATLAATLSVELPSLDTVHEVLDRPGHERDEVRREILSTYLAVRDRVAGASPVVATSCGLGRMLADTALLPRSTKPEMLTERFDPYRLANAYRWLDDLSSAFPLESCGAVKASLNAWEDWVGKLPRKNGTVEPNTVNGTVIRALRSQGEMWRRLISGEMIAKDLLKSDDYVAAGERLLKRARQMAGRFLLRWWPGVLALFASTGAAVWAAITYAPAGSARLAAVLFSLAGALGVSWKTVSATLGKTLSQAESSLWESEVVVAIGDAATLLPTPPKRGESVASDPDAH